MRGLGFTALLNRSAYDPYPGFYCCSPCACGTASLEADSLYRLSPFLLDHPEDWYKPYESPLERATVLLRLDGPPLALWYLLHGSRSGDGPVVDGREPG